VGGNSLCHVARVAPSRPPIDARSQSRRPARIWLKRSQRAASDSASVFRHANDFLSRLGVEWMVVNRSLSLSHSTSPTGRGAPRARGGVAEYRSLARPGWYRVRRCVSRPHAVPCPHFGGLPCAAKSRCGAKRRGHPAPGGALAIIQERRARPVHHSHRLEAPPEGPL
jgi:hypothetical protein